MILPHIFNFVPHEQDFLVVFVNNLIHNFEGGSLAVNNLIVERHLLEILLKLSLSMIFILFKCFPGLIFITRILIKYPSNSDIFFTRKYKVSCFRAGQCFRALIFLKFVSIFKILFAYEHKLV